MEQNEGTGKKESANKEPANSDGTDRGLRFFADRGLSDRTASASGVWGRARSWAAE